MAQKPEAVASLQILKSNIKQKETARLYFFYGEETFLMHHYLQQLKKILVDDLTESFNFHKFTSENFELQSFAAAVENLPMMAEHTMIVVDEVNFFKFNDLDREKMTDILSDIPEYCTVVFYYETGEWKPDKRYKKLYDAITQTGLMVEFAKQDQRDLVAWITRHFAAQKKRISPDLCVYLIDITGGTMTALSGEISKICAYSGAEEIVKSDIDAVTEPVIDAVVFQMTDMLGKGMTGPALTKLRDLLKMQEEPLLILGAIGSHFRKMAAAKTLSDNGGRYTDLMKMYRMSDYGAKKTMDASRKFSERFYKLAAELILETDYQIKTSFDSAERLLELLILRLSMEAKSG